MNEADATVAIGPGPPPPPCKRRPQPGMGRAAKVTGAHARGGILSGSPAAGSSTGASSLKLGLAIVRDYEQYTAGLIGLKWNVVESARRL